MTRPRYLNPKPQDLPHWFAAFSAMLLIAAAIEGCHHSRDAKPDKPEPADNDPVAVAAEAALRDYGLALAKNAREAAGGTYKSNAEVYAAAQKANAQSRTDAFKGLGEAMDAAVKPDAAFDADKIKAAFEAQARGFEKAVSK